MILHKRLLLLSVLAVSGFFFSASVYAECGGQQQCIAVSIDPAVAPAHGTPNVSAPLVFGNQAAATTSATQTIFVGAVTGAGLATLDAINLSGANATDFSITGGTCTIGTPSLLQNGPTCTITVTFNPQAVGAKTAAITVQTTSITRTVPLTGTGTAALTGPTAAAATLAVQVNTATTLDLAPFITGTVTGIAVVVAPTRGVATVSGTSVTYTPARNYFGPDAFSYAAFNTVGSSAAAVVTVNVAGRPDPSQDPVVRGLLGSQAETARRFSRAQIFNFQRRMESLHRGAGDGVTAGAAGFGTVRNPVAGFSLAGSDAQPEHSSLIRVASKPGGLRPTNSAGAASGLLPPSLVTALLSAASTRSVKLNSSDRADGSSGQPEGTGVWISGNLNFGTRDPTGDSNSLRFSTDGVSIGFDQRFSDQLALGIGMGYARDKTDIGTDGTKSSSNASSITVYGSYQPTKNTFVDGLIGYGVLSYDTDRYVASVADFARGRRKGDQWFGSVAAGYEHRNDGLLLSPYGRFDFGINRLKQATETGAGLNALTYFDQTLPTLQLSLGLRAESQHQTNFGWALPRLRVELKHDFESNRQATIAYADQFTGPRYTVTPVGVNRDSLLIGIGSDFLFRSGFKLGIDYQAQRSFGPDSSQAIRVWLSKDLDGKKGPQPTLGLSSSRMFAYPVVVEAGYAWDDNLNRVSNTADKLSDRLYTLNVSKSATFPVSLHTRVVVAGFLNGEKLYTYTGLDRISGGVRGEFQYRTSGAFDAPTFGIFGRALLDEYQSGLRTGHRYSLGINARQSLTDRIDVFGALSSNLRNARNAVFDTKDYSARVNFDYSLGRDGTLYLGGEYRRGDAVTSAPSSPDYSGIAKTSAQDDAYGNRQLFAYRYEAKTVLWTLGYNRPLGARDSLDFSWRRAQSTPTSLGTAGTYSGGTSSSYTANQYSITYLMRF